MGRSNRFPFTLQMVKATSQHQNLSENVCHAVARTKVFKPKKQRSFCTSNPKLFSEILLCPPILPIANSSQDIHGVTLEELVEDDIQYVLILQGYWDDLFDNALKALNTIPLDGDQYVRKGL
jgi:hypothetical protein